MKPLKGGTDWSCMLVVARDNIFEIDGGGTLSFSIDRFSSTSRIDVQAQRVACGPFCPAKFRRVSCRLSSVLIPNDSAESLFGLWRCMLMMAWPFFLQKRWNDMNRQSSSEYEVVLVFAGCGLVHDLYIYRSSWRDVVFTISYNLLSGYWSRVNIIQTNINLANGHMIDELGLEKMAF